MKKVFVIIICFAAQLNALAQLKVHSNGYVSVNNPRNYVHSPISLGHAGVDGYYMSCLTGLNGFYVRVIPDSLSPSPNLGYAGDFRNNGNGITQSVGLRGVAHGTHDNSDYAPVSIGVMGGVNNSADVQGYSYGVRGYLIAKKGAGVFGQSSGGSLYYGFIDDRYAGLFWGKTKVIGNLDVTGSINGTLLSSSVPEMAEGIQLLSTEKESVIEKLGQLDVLSYYLPETSVVKFKDTFSDTSRNLDDVESIKSAMEANKDIITFEEQQSQKSHYTIAVEQLEKAFPDLVYEQKDGKKSINYMEMIPLLVQSINELHAQIKEQQVVINSLTDNDELKKAPAVTGLKLPAATSQAVLYQNTPNPFTERTEIRFSLPDGTASAAICIFDMSGKMLRQIPISSGMQSVTVAGYELSAGMYLYSLVVGGQEVDTKRMILSK